MKIQNFEFSLTFSTKKNIGQKIENCWSQKIVDQKLSDFFRRKIIDQKNSDHLFRSQMIPRFRKSHLEQRATIIKLRTASTKKNFHIFPQYCHKPPSIWIEFRGSSVHHSKISLLNIVDIKVFVRSLFEIR